MKRLFFIVLWCLTSTGAWAWTNGLALKPPMGWNTWYGSPYGNFSAQTLSNIADAFSTNGLLAAGYKYINLDTCWQLGRTVDGVPTTDPARFPGGLLPVANYLHSKGFYFGIYFHNGNHRNDFCSTNLGSYGYETNDANYSASVGADFLKYDLSLGTNDSAALSARKMKEAIDQCGRPMVYSTGHGYPYEGAPAICNCWRVARDLGVSSWISIYQTIDSNAPLYSMAGPGYWNDLDYLLMDGLSGAGISVAEKRTYFGMWCMMASPLILSGPTNYVQATLDIITNAEVIALDQDEAGQQCRLILSTPVADGNAEVWVKPLSGGKGPAVAFLNRGSGPNPMGATWASLGLNGVYYAVRDLWAHKDLGIFADGFTNTVARHDTFLFMLSPPGAVNFRTYNPPNGVDCLIAYANGGPCANGARPSPLINIASNGYNWGGIYARAALYAGPLGAPEDQLQLLAPCAEFSTGAGAGYVSVDTDAVRLLANVPPGEQALVQVRAWDAGMLCNSWEEAQTNAGVLWMYTGKSALLTVTLGDTGSAAALSNLASFSMNYVSSAHKVVTLPAMVWSSSAASLNGRINPDGLEGSAWFEWGATTNYDNATTATNLSAGLDAVTISFDLAELSPASTYHYRVVTTNWTSTNYGADVAFTTPPGIPIVTTLPATAVSATAATLTGSVNPLGSSARGWFEWGTSASYGNDTTGTNLGSGTNQILFSFDLTGLAPSTTYHYRAMGRNLLPSTNWGVDLTFTTTPPVMTISEVLYRPAEGCWLRGNITVGTTATVQASTNLLEWAPFTNCVPDADGWFELIDPEATNYPTRFYRLRYP